MLPVRRSVTDRHQKNDGSSAIVPFICVAMFILVFMPAAVAFAASLTSQEERGRQLYVSGTSPSGSPIVAYFGKDLLEVPGESATCVSCHGYDGLGRSESGVIPSNITWRHIMKSYGHIHPDGLEHGAFNDTSLRSYLQDGLYPGGKQGDPSMPVYRIAAQDLDDLITYLKKLDSYLDPGISDKLIRIGTLRPSEGSSAELGTVMQQTVSAYFNDINMQGGIYGRSLMLSSEQVGNVAVTPRFLRTTNSDQGVFALLNTFTPGIETDLWRMVEEQRVPLIAPYSYVPIEDQLLHRYRFNLHSGLREQVLVLARYATQNLPVKNPHILILYPQREGVDELLVSVEAQYQSKGWNNITRKKYASGESLSAALLLQLRKGNPDLVLFLGGEGDAEAIFNVFGDEGCSTALFMPGVLAGKSIYKIPASCKGRVWLSFPSLPADRKEWGVKEFQAMAARQHLVVTSPTVQLAAYTSVKILVEGLRRAGRTLSRERLLEALESLFEYDTGLSPLITYNKNRRIGALGAYIIEVDPSQIDTQDFIVPRGWIPAQSP
jgi:ABC-type branched-subunit amino acid transport system substrate-binding protein